MVKTIVAAVMLVGCATAPVAPQSLSAVVRLLDGTQQSWSALLAEQPQTIVVFATVWCEICKRERPEVAAWARAHPHQVVYVFSGGELPGVAAQVRAFGMDAEVMRIVVDADGKLADGYGVQATPTVLVLGPQGELRTTQHRFAAAVGP